MERLKHMEEVLMGCVQAQLSHLDTVDTEELGQAIDMIKDLEQAKYYCSIVKAMEEAEEDEPKEKSYHHREKKISFRILKILNNKSKIFKSCKRPEGHR